jgi:hypothetical protein
VDRSSLMRSGVVVIVLVDVDDDTAVLATILLRISGFPSLLLLFIFYLCFLDLGLAQ